MTRSELEVIIKRRAAITVTIFAALLAVNTMLGNSNSSKVLTNTIQSNNMWSWYQAKNIRSVVYEATNKDVAAARMKSDMEDIMIKAQALEAERDVAKAKGPYYTYAGAALQLGIVLSTAAILAVTMPLFWLSVGVGSLGAVLMTVAYKFV
jgi:propanediol dehydratase small subunit